MNVTIQYRLRSHANARAASSRLAMARTKKTERGIGKLLAQPFAPYVKPNARYIVTLERHAPRKLDDDNLAYAFKSIRDGVAAALGVDDGDERRVLWRYAQVRSKAYAVSARIEEAE